MATCPCRLLQVKAQACPQRQGRGCPTDPTGHQGAGRALLTPQHSTLGRTWGISQVLVAAGKDAGALRHAAGQEDPTIDSCSRHQEGDPGGLLEPSEGGPKDSGALLCGHPNGLGILAHASPEPWGQLLKLYGDKAVGTPLPRGCACTTYPESRAWRCPERRPNKTSLTRNPAWSRRQQGSPQPVENRTQDTGHRTQEERCPSEQ